MNVEPQLDNLISNINKSLEQILTDNLSPIIKYAQNTHSQNDIIHNLLKQLPEYQELLLENKNLKETINHLMKNYQIVIYNLMSQFSSY